MQEILGTLYINVSEGFQRGIYPIARCIKSEKHDLAVVYAIRGADMDVKQIGNMDNDRKAFKNPQCGRVYDSKGLSPTINTCQGGQREPKIIVQTKPLGNLNGHKSGSGYAGSVYDANALAPTINTMGGGNREPMIVSMRGRNPDNPSDRTAGSPTEQRLEPNSQGICSTLTSVQKDNLLLETGLEYRIRKLTPLECWRLMGFSDEDFYKAEEVNSNSQLYKQAGNSIVKNVLMDIFREMLPRKGDGVDG